MRLLSLLAQALAVQAAAVAGKAVANGAGAKLPVGTGPLAANLFTGVDLRTISEAPAFVGQLRMPVISSAALDRLKPQSAKGGSESHVEVRKTLAAEIRSSGVLGPLAASSRKKYNESVLAEAFAAGVLMSFDPTTNGPPSAAGPGGRRLLGFWGDLWDAVTGAVEDLGCGGFATGALPGYLASYALFHAGNSGYSKLNGQQKFFQRAGGFSTELLNKVNVKYGAWFAPGFGSASAVTMGSEIYVKGASNVLDTLPTYNLTVSPAFIAQTRLLMHEMGHSKQYAARSWNIATFGWDYLFRYCKAGFSYSKNSMEVDAETYRDNSDKLMTPVVSAHFKKWRKSSLESAVGYSKSPAEYTNFNIGTTAIMSLDMVKVTTKLGESQRKSGSACVRVLSGSALGSRTQAEVSGFPWDCVNVKPTSAPTRKPTTRAPTRPPTFGIVSGTILGLSPTLKVVQAPTFKPVP